ncbi:hypothetical protein [Acidaminococcus sp.]|uniref:hypothetical protein n=1 Tax=Acidaminococcus sp. TaxID=1872103 RepID=UPI003D7D7C5B
MSKSYIVDGNPATVDFAPRGLVEEVLQNVRTILSTVKYSVPLDREFGVSGSVVDLPMPQAKAMLSGEIFAAVKRYEPRAIIQSIDFSGEENGKLVPALEVRIVGSE